MKKKREKQAELEEPYEDAHEIALEFLKQLIALSSGVLALSAAFIENFMPATLPQIFLLVFSWSSLAFSIYFGLQAISAIVQSRLVRGLNWADGRGRKYTGASKYLFITGIIFFAVFAFVSFLGNSGVAP
ncbi:MAG: hypothetical protein Fur0017_06340 [Anaerolineales bacterium]